MAKAWSVWCDFGKGTPRRSPRPAEPEGYAVKHWCFCGKELHLRKIGRVSGENLSSAFEALPEHAQEDGARCPYGGQQPRFDPRPHEMVKFGPVELDRKAAAENLSRLLSRTARLFARPASLAPAE